MKPLIVIVEDTPDLLELLEYNLEKEGYEVLGFLNTKRVSEIFDDEDISLVIMDRNLPGIEGAEFIKRERELGFKAPVIFLSAKDKNEEIEEGFLHGGDDYITKPFNMKELLLRIKAILNRTRPSSVNLENLTYRDITMNRTNRSVLINNQNHELSKLEFDLLATLIEHQNGVLERGFLIEHVWKNEEACQDKTVNVAINRLKDKIDPTKEKNYIKTVRGVGYTLC
jgi:DNA-binding response OmpR family regulator